jgi:hypothetical protein
VVALVFPSAPSPGRPPDTVEIHTAKIPDRAVGVQIRPQSSGAMGRLARPCWAIETRFACPSVSLRL